MLDDVTGRLGVVTGRLGVVTGRLGVVTFSHCMYDDVMVCDECWSWSMHYGALSR